MKRVDVVLTAQTGPPQTESSNNQTNQKPEDSGEGDIHLVEPAAVSPPKLYPVCTLLCQVLA